MSRRWDIGVTLAEIIVVIAVVGILVGIGVYSYSTVHRDTASRTMQSNLQQAIAHMQKELFKNGEYPSAIPDELQTNNSVTLEMVETGLTPYYDSLTTVQHGVLFADICQELIDEGVGNGVNQGGVTEDYIMGCGNWNSDSMQITGWTSKVYDTPVQKQTLVNYASTFVSNDSWNKTAHEYVVKTFYGQLVERFEERGGLFPLTSFWDSWATPQNGGVIYQPLPTDGAMRPHYCIQASHSRYPDLIWHATEKQKLLVGTC